MNETNKNHENINAEDSADVTAAARTAPLSESDRPDANVSDDGQCILAMDGEMARPDSGDPCDGGHSDARAYESAGVFQKSTDDDGKR